MATNITAQWNAEPPNGVSAVISVVVSLADVVVNTTPNASGGWNTATVTADLARGHYLLGSSGCPAGYYEKVGASTFQLQPSDSTDI